MDCLLNVYVSFFSVWVKNRLLQRELQTYTLRTTNKSYYEKNNNYILLLLVLYCPSIVFGQIAYTQEFNGCTGQTCEKWQLSGSFCKKDQTIQLEWATRASHYAYFSIERATSHSEFKTIGKICGEKPRSELQSYVFVDQKPALGKSYFYRVKMIDFYEHFIYS